MYEYKSCGIPNVFLKNGYTIEQDPDYGELVSIEDLEGLHRALALKIISGEQRMNRHEFRFLRVEMDLSQKDLAGILGVSEPTVRNWESGRVDIPKMADSCLRQFYEDQLAPGSHAAKALQNLAKANREIHRLTLEREALSNEWSAEMELEAC